MRGHTLSRWTSESTITSCYHRGARRKQRRIVLGQPPLDLKQEHRAACGTPVEYLGHALVEQQFSSRRHWAMQLQTLFDAYDYCREQGIDVYGGGQWELGPGRGHIQYLAALFHADAPNDVAPGGYNAERPAPGLPASPLAPRAAPTGFRRSSD